MLYESGEAYRASKRKSVLLFGMSGVGKTRAAALLREAANWYHYSVDYRIGTRYLGERITDTVKLAAMQVPLLRDLLRSDSIVVRSKLAFENLVPLSKYVGAPGDPAKGGLTFEEYRRRQRKHATAELAATKDAEEFIERARRVYGYEHFVCDSSGSICELADHLDPEDPVFTHVSRHMLPIYIRVSEQHRSTLIDRFRKAPKPMYFHENFLDKIWKAYLGDREECAVDPSDFLVFAFERLLDWRLPRYEALAMRWGVCIEGDDLARIASATKFDDLTAAAIAGRGDTRNENTVGK